MTRITSTSDITISPSDMICSMAAAASSSFSAESITEIMTGRSRERCKKLCYGGSGDLHQTQSLDDRIVKGLAVPLVRLAQKNAHQPSGLLLPLFHVRGILRWLLRG